MKIPFSAMQSAVSSHYPPNLFTSGDGYFQIATNSERKHRVYYLYAVSKEEETQWVVAINYWKDFISHSGTSL